MNPLEFSWTEDQQVTVVNPTGETYKFKVHNKEYQLGAGQRAKMPGYIAWIYVYGLSTQLCQADGKWNRWNEEGFRKEYYEKLVAGTDDLIQEVKVEPELVQQLDEKKEEKTDRPIAELRDEVKKLGIKLPFGNNKAQLEQLIVEHQAS